MNKNLTLAKELKVNSYAGEANYVGMSLKSVKQETPLTRGFWAMRHDYRPEVKAKNKFENIMLGQLNRI